MIMPRAKPISLDGTLDAPSVTEIADRALLGDVREAMEEAMRAHFAQAERTVAQRLSERLAGADALIKRLTEENERLRAEVERHEKTLAALRELASDIL